MAVSIHDTHPGDGEAWRLELYWTKGEGLTRWVGNPHPWTTLYNLLLPHIKNPNFCARLTETYFVKVFGFHSGSRKGLNPVGPG
jgi:hypothetical protein